MCLLSFASTELKKSYLTALERREAVLLTLVDKQVGCHANNMRLITMIKVNKQYS